MARSGNRDHLAQKNLFQSIALPREVLDLQSFKSFGGKILQYADADFFYHVAVYCKIFIIYGLSVTFAIEQIYYCIADISIAANQISVLRIFIRFLVYEALRNFT